MGLISCSVHMEEWTIRNGTSMEGGVGNKIKLTAEVSPSNAINKNVIWTSSNSKAATVNNSGVVTMAIVDKTDSAYYN